LRRFAPPWVALLGWLAAACAMAQPRSANPFPFALLLALCAVAVATGGWGSPRGRMLAAAALSALAAAFRLDFALYGVAAVVVAMLVDTGAPWRARLSLAGGYAAVTAALALALYAPFLIDVGPAPPPRACSRWCWLTAWPTGSWPCSTRRRCRRSTWPPRTASRRLPPRLARSNGSWRRCTRACHPASRYTSPRAGPTSWPTATRSSMCSPI